MIEDHIKMLIATIQKLYSRGARHNIQRILSKTHKADVAEILAGLPQEERHAIFMMEPSVDKRADILSYLDQDVQKNLLSHLDKNEIHRLVSLMDSDDAADLLRNMSEEESKDVLASMVKEDSQDVADLMGYPEDTAGGLMSSDYLAINRDSTVGQAIAAIQEEEEDLGSIFYIYVINDNEQLVGVVSLKQLLLSKKSQLLKDIMHPDVISVSLDTEQDEVARVVERYDFLSLPVVGLGNRLEGVITVDDVIDVIREEAEEDIMAMGRAGLEIGEGVWENIKSRYPWLILAFVGGAISFSIVYFFGFLGEGSQRQVDLFWLIAAFIPLLLSLGATTGSQSATVVLGFIRSGKFELNSSSEFLKTELKLSVIFGIGFAILIYGLSEIFFSPYKLSWVFSASMGIQIFLSMATGALLPAAMNKVGLDPRVGTVPLFTILADLTAMLVLFGLLHSLN